MGGVLGVCSGFSFITACELLYWFTIRILGDHFSNKNKISSKTSTTKESDNEEDNKGSDYEILKSEIKDLKSRNAKLEASNAEIKNLLKELIKTKNNSPTKEFTIEMPLELED